MDDKVQLENKIENKKFGEVEIKINRNKNKQVSLKNS